MGHKFSDCALAGEAELYIATRATSEAKGVKLVGQVFGGNFWVVACVGKVRRIQTAGLWIQDFLRNAAIANCATSVGETIPSTCLQSQSYTRYWIGVTVYSLAPPEGANRLRISLCVRVCVCV